MLFVYFSATSASGEVLDVLSFIQRHPSVLLKMVSFGLASAIGQVCILIIFLWVESVSSKAVCFISQ